MLGSSSLLHGAMFFFSRGLASQAHTRLAAQKHILLKEGVKRLGLPTVGHILLPHGMLHISPSVKNCM